LRTIVVPTIFIESDTFGPVEASVERLPVHHREVFVLRELEGSRTRRSPRSSCNLGTVKVASKSREKPFATIIEPHLDWLARTGESDYCAPRRLACGARFLGYWPEELKASLRHTSQAGTPVLPLGTGGAIRSPGHPPRPNGLFGVS
jgi:hypothetical protein